MTIWENFEIQCTKYLNKHYGEYAKFTHKGGSDSTIPDIEVNTNSGRTFYIDAKHCPAQCGQFVLLPDISSRTFTYSPLNSNRINIYAQKIIEYMNTKFDEFKEAGSSGKSIILQNNSDIFSNWIIQNYQDKKTYFFITNNYTILPIERLHEYFNVTARYRVKRSGSHNIGKRNMSTVLNYIKSQNYLIQNFREDGNKLFITSDKPLHNERFTLCGYEYMFSLRNSEYEIRKLSNTFNANVIFSIELKSSKNGMMPHEFILVLK